MTDKRKYTYNQSIGNINIPIKNIDNDNIEILISYVQQGDYNKIKNFASEKNTIFNVTNENKENVLHLLIKNQVSGMTEQQKYELIKIFIDNDNSLVSNFDKYNITPLHLASKYQYESIVSLLLNNGADPLLVDNQKMSPLHYVCQGNIMECKKRKIVKSLIPKENISKNPSIELKNITVNIIDVLHDDNIRKFMAHIKNSILNIRYMLPEIFDDFENSIKNDIAKIISDDKMTDVEKKQYMYDLYETKIKLLIESMTNKKISSALIPVDIKMDLERGWSPDNSIGPIINADIYENIKENDNKMEQKRTKIINDLNSLINDIDTKFSEMYGTGNSVFSGIREILLHNMNLYYNVGRINGIVGDEMYVDWNELANNILYKDNNPFYFQEINIITDEQLTHHQVEVVSGITPRGVLRTCLGEFTYTGAHMPRSKDNQIFYYPMSLNNIDVEVVKAVKHVRNEWKNRRTNYENISLTDDYQFIYIQNLQSINTKNQVQDLLLRNGDAEIYPDDMLLIESDFNFIYGEVDNRYIINTPLNYIIKNNGIYADNPYYFISKYIFGMHQIKKHIKLLNNHTKILIDHLKINNLYRIHSTFIPYIIISILNISQYISFIKKEKEYINNTANTIKKKFADKFSQYENMPYAYSIEYAMDIIENIKNNINKDIVRLEDIYSKLINIQKQFNEINDYMSLNTLSVYMKAYIGTKDNPVLNNDNYTRYFSNIIDRPIKTLNILPTNHDDYIKEYYDYDHGQGPLNHLYNKRKITENFIPCVNNKNFHTFFNNNNIMQTELYNIISKHIIETRNRHVIGYIDIDQQILPAINVPGIQNIPKKGYIYKWSSINIRIFNNEIFPSIIGGNNALIINRNAIVSGSDLSYIGSYGIFNNNHSRDRISSVFPSIGKYVDEYLKIIKIYVIQQIIEYFFNNANNYKNNLYQYIQKYNISNANAIEKILYITIGKITDDLIITTIKKYIISASKDIVYNTIQTKFDNIKLENINIPIHNFPKQILNTDNNFKINFNKLCNDIVSEFMLNVIIDDSLYNNLRYHGKTVQDEEQIDLEKYFKIYNSNYGTIESVTDLCHKLNPNIINILVEHGADINQKDLSNHTPLYYSLNINNPTLVNTILINGAFIYDKKLKNNSGKTPYEYALNLYEHHNNFITNKQNNITNILNKLCDDMYNNIKKSLQAKTEYGNNIINYLDIILKMMLIMYNNQFHIYMMNYINEWNKINADKLIILLKKYNIIGNDEYDFIKNIPLIKNIPNVLNKDDNLNILTTKNGELNKDIEKIDNDIIKYRNKIANMGFEQTNPNSTNAINAMYNNKINSMNRTINNLQIEKRRLENKKLNINRNVNLKSNQLNADIRYNKINMDTTKYSKARNIAKSYDNIFNDVYETQYNLYNESWNFYIKNDANLKNITNIHFLVVILQSHLQDELKNNNNIRELKDNFETLNELYKNIFEFNIINNFELPQKYNYDNIFLKDQIDIIVHCSKHIIFLNLHNTIIRVLIEYLKTLNQSVYIEKQYDNISEHNVFKDVPINDTSNKFKNIRHENLLFDGDKYPKYVSKIINRFINYNDNDVNPNNKKPLISKYILNDMPVIATKIVLNIWNDDDDYDDPDKKYESLDKLFENLLNIIKMNPVVAVDENTSFIKNIRQYIIPYFKDIITNTIPIMKKLLDNYNRLILNEGRHVEIMKLFLDKIIQDNTI